MSYEMRNLKTGDIYKMSRILKKMDLKFDVQEGITQEQMGIYMIQKVLENLHLAEKEVNEFLSELIGITPKEFADLPLGEVINIYEQFKNQKDLIPFLKLAGK